MPTKIRQSAWNKKILRNINKSCTFLYYSWDDFIYIFFALYITSTSTSQSYLTLLEHFVVQLFFLLPFTHIPPDKITILLLICNIIVLSAFVSVLWWIEVEMNEIHWKVIFWTLSVMWIGMWIWNVGYLRWVWWIYFRI
jgi:hypothetical protein